MEINPNACLWFPLQAEASGVAGLNSSKLLFASQGTYFKRNRQSPVGAFEWVLRRGSHNAHRAGRGLPSGDVQDFLRVASGLNDLPFSMAVDLS